MDKKGDIFYEVEWYLGFDEDSRWWDENCSHEDKESPTFELVSYEVKSVRCRRGGNYKVVTAYKRIKYLSIDNKGKLLPVPDPVCREQWNLGNRPNHIRPTKVGAYVAALAEIRASSEFDKNKHAKLVGGIKTGLTKARKASYKKHEA